jgi:hypothetical protein
MLGYSRWQLFKGLAAAVGVVPGLRMRPYLFRGKSGKIDVGSKREMHRQQGEGEPLFSSPALIQACAMST